MTSPNPALQMKVVLLGEGCVGKTSLVLRFVQDQFVEKHNSTIQASFTTKKMTVGRQKVILNIWDTAGQERFHALGPIYYRDAQAAILVYDITDHDSFQKVKTWVKELRRMRGQDVLVAIVGNKLDLEKERHVDSAEAQNYAASVGGHHYQTSAKTNRGVEDLFVSVVQNYLQLKVVEEEQSAQQNVTNFSSGVVVVEDSVDQLPKKSCCSSS